MKVNSLAGAASATRNAMLQMITQTAAGAAGSANAGTSAPMSRPAAMAPPPPRASSFGGADPRAMFEALVQSFDSDGDSQLSLGEVNALNQGGLLARSFARIDTNSDARLSGDEVAAAAPWGGSMPASGDPGGGEKGADVRPLIDKLTDHLTNNRDAALIAQDLAAIRRAEFAQAAAEGPAGLPAAQLPTRSGQAADPATLMESMVLALSNPDEAETTRTGDLRQTYSLR